VLVLVALHQADHVLRADNSGWPLTPDVTPFTISFIVYPLMALDFGYLRNRPWVRVGWSRIPSSSWPATALSAAAVPVEVHM
jgi:hypothetical protein